MRLIAATGGSVMARRIVVTFIQAQVLRFFLGGLRTFDHDGVEGRLQQFCIVDVGSVTLVDMPWKLN